MRKTPRIASFICAAAVLAGTSGWSAAQVGGTTATLRGNVADGSGGVTPGASVTLLDVGTKAVRTAVTDARGGFTFPGLFPGTYQVEIRCANAAPA